MPTTKDKIVTPEGKDFEGAWFSAPYNYVAGLHPTRQLEVASLMGAKFGIDVGAYQEIEIRGNKAAFYVKAPPETMETLRRKFTQLPFFSTKETIDKTNVTAVTEWLLGLGFLELDLLKLGSIIGKTGKEILAFANSNLGEITYDGNGGFIENFLKKRELPKDPDEVEAKAELDSAKDGKA